MIDKLLYNQCSLCRACSNICPIEAISYDNSVNGFQYPVIDFDKCIKCNKCEKVCPVLHKPYKVSKEFPKCFAARSKEKDVRLKSTSGALFYEAAKYTIEHGGYVCAAVFDSDFNVKHIISNEISDLNRMRGSKYLLSNTKNIYREIKKVLDQNKMLLFCGCPCQVAGLNNYLQKPFDNLFLIDFICEGIPSQEIFNEYKQVLERKYKSKVVEYQFRKKIYGWHNSYVEVRFENGKCYRKPFTVDAYTKALLSRTIMNEACYQCQFKNFQSGSDLTIGDFWGAEITLKEFDDNTGISAVFANNIKGMNMLKKIQIEKIPVNKEVIVKYNLNVEKASHPGEKRMEFLELGEKKGYGNAIVELFKESRIQIFKRKIGYYKRYFRNMLEGKGRPIY